MLTFATRNMCPGPFSEIACCVPDATSPLSPKPQEEPSEEPSEPVLSFLVGSDLSMFPDTWPSNQDEGGLILSNFEPAENLQANALPEDFFGIQFASNPSFDPTFDSGLFDVAILSVGQENEFTASLDGHQFSQDSLFALGLDSEENLWIS